MNGGMGLHSCIAQVGFESGHGMFLLWHNDYEIRCALMNYEHDVHIFSIPEVLLCGSGDVMQARASMGPGPKPD